VSRGALDPKAHYKKLDTTKFPKYFQLGTVVEGAADFYSGGWMHAAITYSRAVVEGAADFYWVLGPVVGVFSVIAWLDSSGG